MSLIPADATTALAAVIFGLAWLGFWADHNKYARKVSGVPWVSRCAHPVQYTRDTARVACLRVRRSIPAAARCAVSAVQSQPTHDVHAGWLGAVHIPVASVGVVVGAVSGYFLFDLGDAGAKIAGTYAGAFIGGVVNFVAISQAVQMTPTEFSVSLGASAPASIVGLLILVTLPSIPFIRRHIPSKIIDQADAADMTHEAEELPRFRLDHVSAAIAISLAICAVSNYICTRFGIGTYNLFVVTVITVILANIAPRQFAKLEGDFALGMLCMYAFFAMIGAGTDAVGFVRSAPILFVYCTFMLVVHFIVLLVASKLLKFDLAEAIIGSCAAIVGPAASAGIASAKGWKTLLTPAITIGMLGYVIANFVGIAIYQWLR